MLLSALVKPPALAVNCLVARLASISKFEKAATPFPAAVPISRFVLPSNGPLPDVKVTVSTLFGGRPTVESLPNWSRARTTGWIPKGAPAMAELG